MQHVVHIHERLITKSVTTVTVMTVTVTLPFFSFD